MTTVKTEPLPHRIGTAGIADGCTIPGMKLADNCELYAIAGRSIDKAEQYRRKFGFERAERKELVGGTPEENAEITRAILCGAKGYKRDAVLMNAGAALYIGGKAGSIQDGITRAGELIDSGRAMRTLEKLIELSNS